MAGRAITASSVPFKNSECFSSLFCPLKARPEVLLAQPNAVQAFVGIHFGASPNPAVPWSHNPFS